MRLFSLTCSPFQFNSSISPSLTRFAGEDEEIDEFESGFLAFGRGGDRGGSPAGDDEREEVGG